MAGIMTAAVVECKQESRGVKGVEDWPGRQRFMSMIGRRSFLQQSVLCLGGLGGGMGTAWCRDEKPVLRVGLMTDLHYADKEERGTRFYRQALMKLDEAVERMNQERPDLVVELGDLIDQAESVELEMEWLKTIESHYARLRVPRHYVLGNHCVGTLTKKEFAGLTQASGGHAVLEQAGIRFLILDACFREDGVAYERGNFDWKDGNLPTWELAWLEAELTRQEGPVVVLAHQRLDDAGAHSVRNAGAVRAVLEKSGRVLAVFQGHSHKNDYQQIQGIHYVTLVAMVEGSGAESSGYSMLEVMADGSLRVNGFRRQQARDLVVGA
jgi:predicted phosphodiesterase